jgi:hypothetical protein
MMTLRSFFLEWRIPKEQEELLEECRPSYLSHFLLLQVRPKRNLDLKQGKATPILNIPVGKANTLDKDNPNSVDRELDTLDWGNPNSVDRELDSLDKINPGTVDKDCTVDKGKQILLVKGKANSRIVLSVSHLHSLDPIHLDMALMNHTPKGNFVDQATNPIRI